MNTTISLSSTDILTLLCLLGISVIVVSYIMRHQLQKILFNSVSKRNRSTLLKSQWNVYRQSTFQGSLACSIGAVIIIFSWTSNEGFSKEGYSEIPEYIEDIQIPPTHFFSKPPPPPPPSIKIEEVIDPQDEEDYLFSDQDITEDAAIEEPQEVVVSKEEKAPIVNHRKEEQAVDMVGISEKMPRFPACEEMDGDHDDKMKCGQEKLIDLLYKKLRYPPLAIDMGLEGMCIVQFEIHKDGSIHNLKLVRDIGSGCGEASLRAVKSVISTYGPWVPGRQRGIPVKVLYSLPIKFKLEPHR